MQSFLPTFAIVNMAKESDSRKAWEVCAGLKAGEIVVFDKAYVDFSHLHRLQERGVFWVSRAKGNMKFCCGKRRLKKPEGNILRDDEILLSHSKSRRSYPARLRMVVALVEINSKLVEMTFITNNREGVIVKTRNSLIDILRELFRN